MTEKISAAAFHRLYKLDSKQNLPCPWMGECFEAVDCHHYTSPENCHLAKNAEAHGGMTNALTELERELEQESEVTRAQVHKMIHFS